MLHASRPFRARLRGLFLIPRPGLAAGVGLSCSLRAQTSIPTTTMLRAGAPVLPPFLEIYSRGCASCAALCTLRWCGSVVTSGIWLLGAQMQPLKVAGKHQACHASQQGAGDDVDLQHRAAAIPALQSPAGAMDERDGHPGNTRPAQDSEAGRMLRLGKTRRNSLSGQRFSVGGHGCMKTEQSPCFPALIPQQMALKSRIQ